MDKIHFLLSGNLESSLGISSSKLRTVEMVTDEKSWWGR